MKLILTFTPAMLKRLFGRTSAPAEPETPPQPARAARCGGCPLAACAAGCKAAVLSMEECDHGEAHRLRGLGLFEGALVKVLDSRNGMLLEVKGARLALGASLASSIRVLPLGS